MQLLGPPLRQPRQPLLAPRLLEKMGISLYVHLDSEPYGLATLVFIFLRTSDVLTYRCSSLRYEALYGHGDPAEVPCLQLREPLSLTLCRSSWRNPK